MNLGADGVNGAQKRADVGRSEKGASQLLKRFQILNFRGFKALELSGMERVCLIAGANNVGKTAFLEAMFAHLGSGNPQIASSLDGMRGIPQVGSSARGMWGWLFHGRDLTQDIVLRSFDDHYVNRSLRISVEPAQPTAFPAFEEGADQQKAVADQLSTEAPFDLVLRFDGEAEGESGVTSRIRLQPGRGMTAEPASVQLFPLSIFVPTGAKNPQTDAERFSALQTDLRDGEIVEWLKAVEPRLRRLGVSLMGGIGVIHADVGDGFMLPVPLLGQGMERLLSILLAIGGAGRGGLVLVDEIDNGVHHSALQRVWKAVGEAARRADVQVVTTTHSWECIQAAHRAFLEHFDYDFSLHRIERSRKSGLTAVTYDKETVEAALDAEMEVR